MILFVLYSGRRIRTLNCPFSLGITVPLFSELVSLFGRNMQTDREIIETEEWERFNRPLNRPLRESGKLKNSLINS